MQAIHAMEELAGVVRRAGGTFDDGGCAMLMGIRFGYSCGMGVVSEVAKGRFNVCEVGELAKIAQAVAEHGPGIARGAHETVTRMATTLSERTNLKVHNLIETPDVESDEDSIKIVPHRLFAARAQIIGPGLSMFNNPLGLKTGYTNSATEWEIAEIDTCVDVVGEHTPEAEAFETALRILLKHM